LYDKDDLNRKMRNDGVIVLKKLF